MFDAGTIWASEGNALIAEEDIIKTTAGKLTLDAGRGDSTIYLAGDVKTLDGDLVFEDRVEANNDDSDQMFDADGEGKDLIADEDIIKTTIGSLTLGAGTQHVEDEATIYLAGDVTTVNGDLIFWDKVIANDDSSDQVFDADGDGKDLIADDDIIKTTIGSLTLGAGTQDVEDEATIYLAGDVKTDDGDLIFWDKVIANDTTSDQVFNADGEGKDLMADDDIIKTTVGNLTLGAGSGSDAWIDLNGDVRVEDGSLTIWDKFKAFGDLIASEDIMLTDDGYFDGTGSPLDQTANAQNGTLTAEGWLWKTTPGNLYLLGNNDDPEHQGGKAIDLQYAGCLPAASTCEGNLELYAPNGDIQISGDLTTFGWCEDPPDICEWYDRPTTGGVSVIAENGKIYTEGAFAETSPGVFEPALNIGIVGNSDQLYEGGALGVDLLPGPGKAAIVVMSSQDLIFGPDTMLIARGTYYDDGSVDDRPGVGFLATPGTAIPSPGPVRDEGIPIDVAVYVASTGTDTDPLAGQGDVHLDGRAIDVADGGTMVVDAYDTVTFGDFDTFDLEGFEDCEDLACFLIKLALRFHEDIDFEDLCAYAAVYEWPVEPTLEDFEDFLNDYFDEGFFFNIDRMEVVSRITEWLPEAAYYDRLPYAGDPAGVAAFEAFIGGDYILRGAGLGNPFIMDGRAWVLEDLAEWAPLGEAQVAEAEAVAFGPGGCPPLMAWLAGELGIPEETIRVYLADAFLYSTAIQPCDACARLMDAATVLEDTEGTRIAALAQVVNEFVAPDAPIAPEQMASIASTMVSPEAGTQYAAAGEWLDALAEYVGILNAEMGFSVPESIAFVNKYLTPIAELDNASVAAYVEAQLAALGG